MGIGEHSTISNNGNTISKNIFMATSL